MHAYLSSDFFSKSTFSKVSVMKTITVSISFDPEQTRYLVGPDIGLRSMVAQWKSSQYMLDY